MALLSEVNSIAPGSPGAWLIAIRPHTLWAAIAPVLVGTSLAIADGVWHAGIFIVTLVAALAIQIGVNFANDAADAAKGADTAARIGPRRAVSGGLLTPRQIWMGIGVVFGIATVGGLYLAYQAGPVVVVIGVLSLAAALGYTNGPAPYGYRGLGEVFVFVFFGLIATGGTRYVFDGTLPTSAWIGGISMGLLATAVLVANNYRDIDTDAAAGKRTLAVRLGRIVTARLFVACVAGGVIVGPLGAIAGALPSGALVAVVAAVPAALIVRSLRVAESGPSLIAVLQGTARLQLFVALLLAGGIVATGG